MSHCPFDELVILSSDKRLFDKPRGGEEHSGQENMQVINSIVSFYDVIYDVFFGLRISTVLYAHAQITRKSR
jgi:hypothetical protein